MPKEGTIHKSYKEVKVVMTNNEEFVTRSTYANNTMKLDIDCKTHPAWTNQAGYINTRASEVSKFNDRYAGLDFMSKKAASSSEADSESK